MQLNPYLMFKGECRAAFEFYAKVLGAKIEAMMTHEGTPAAEHVPPEWRGKIMHARLAIGDKVLMGSDSPDRSDTGMSGFSVTLGNGTVRMPIQKTFWAERFGMLTDRFGTPWMINCDAKQ